MGRRWLFWSWWNEMGRSALYLKAVVEYDGTDYRGFQYQPEGPTIQEEIEKALARLTGLKVRIKAAGRTDAGVHSLGQVIAFRVEWKHPLEELHRGLNALLPEDIVVKELTPASEDFHPRFSAVSREYRYTILNTPWRSPLRGRFAYHFAEPLDMEAMNEAASFLVGQHDFASFGMPPQGENTVREVYQAEWRREGDFLHFDIVANAFLRRMVRLIVGTLLRVGTGKLSPGDVKAILEARDINLSGPAVPAQGLCLVKVNYT
ncbi:MAG: tRNA pseudouridine(38-40) synthase TruA [Chloroflexi bacterium]|nr:MAG: tRNA pseudouridine(38-40) synthase TruA [Chloroflexota bacterium]